jgi:hypothetical protein
LAKSLGVFGTHTGSKRAERARSRFIQHFQELEIRVDCFRAFDMKNGCQHAVLQAPVNIIDMAADADAALRLPLDTEKKRHHDEERSKLSVGQIE